MNKRNKHGFKAIKKPKHPAYCFGIKIGSTRILFRDTYIRYVYQGDGFRTERCVPRTK